MPSQEPVASAATTPVYRVMVMLTCGACHHEEVCDETGARAMHQHLHDAHGTTWEPVDD